MHPLQSDILKQKKELFVYNIRTKKWIQLVYYTLQTDITQFILFDKYLLREIITILFNAISNIVITHISEICYNIVFWKIETQKITVLCNILVIHVKGQFVKV